MKTPPKLIPFLCAAVALLVLPLLTQMVGSAWVRIIDMALLYMLLALGLNIVVGYAGLLDLGYVAFYALGAYMFAWLASPHLWETYAWVHDTFKNGLHAPWYLVIPLGAVLAAFLGVLLGAPTLKLRGDYLAIVTLGFGEIIRIFMRNLNRPPANLTNGAQGILGIDSIKIFGYDFDKRFDLFSWDMGGQTYTLEMTKVTNYYYLFLILVVLSVVVCYNLERSRVGRAWMAIREDEIAAKAMGINTRNLKLLAFGMGATFGGVSGVMFGAFQNFVSPESFTLQESVVILAMVVVGGIGHIPGVIIGALLLAALPEVLRYVGAPMQELTGGRLDAAILRQLLVALAMICTMLIRPRGLWPAPEHGKPALATTTP